MPNTAVYCPGIDEEHKYNLAKMVSCEWVSSSNVYGGGQGGLARVDSEMKLFILCHGNEQVPVFQTEMGCWTPEQLARLLISDGLQKEHLDIELLVCYAGASLMGERDVSPRMKIFTKNLQIKEKIKNAGTEKLRNEGEKNLDKLRVQMKKVLNKSQHQIGSYAGGKQLLPLGQQFFRAMRNRGFQKLRVTGYAAPVSVHYEQGKPNCVALNLKDLQVKGYNMNSDQVEVAKFRVLWSGN